LSVKVFLVEDLKAIHSLMAELLATVGGFEVLGIAGTEAEAKLWLDEHKAGWDLAIVDLVLEQGSGMEVVRHARRAGSGRIAVFSGYASPGIRANCLRLGADEVFDKADTEAFTSWLASLRDARSPSA
jgi:DNA-binding NarL/FixJ family response regulator